MISVSQECYELMQSRTNFLEYATITLVDTTVLNLGPGQFTISNNILTDGASTSGLPVGVAVEKVIQIELANTDGEYDEYDFNNAVIQLSLKLQLSNSVETINKGVYTVIEPVMYGETIRMTAADDMYKADKDIVLGTNTGELNISFPITLANLLSAICTATGIDIASSYTFTNSTLSMSTFAGDMTQYTYRQLIGYIAQFAGGNARIGCDNKIQILTYPFTLLNTMESLITEDSVVLSEGFPLTLAFAEDPTTFEDASFVLYDSQGTAKKTWNWTTLQTLISSNTIVLPSDATIEAITNVPCVLEIKWLSAYDGTWHAYRIILPTLDNSDREVETLTNWETLTVATDDVIITGIQTTLSAEQLADSDDNETDTVLIGTDDYVIELENPFFNYSNTSMSDQTNNVLLKIGNLLINGKFRPFEGSHIANPLVEFMDPIYITTRRGKVFASVLTDIDFQVLGLTNMINSAEPKLRTGKVYSSAAKMAQVKAVASAEKKVSTVRNYFWHDTDGAHVSTVQNDATSGPNSLMDANGFAVRSDTTEVARFGGTKIELGKNSTASKIKMCADIGEISVGAQGSGTSLDIIAKETTGSVYKGSTIFLEAQCPSNTWDKVAHIVIQSSQYASDGSNQEGYINLRARGGGIHFDQSPLKAYGSSLLFGDGSEQLEISNFATFFKYMPYNDITGWQDTLTDADNAPKMNLTRLSNSHGVSHVPVSNACWLLTLGSSSSNKLQFCTAANNTVFTLYMRKCSNDSWGNWKSITFS